jgi:hypothetical protein
MAPYVVEIGIRRAKQGLHLTQKGSALVFCFWLAKFRILATKQKPFLLTCTKALFWGKK